MSSLERRISAALTVIALVAFAGCGGGGDDDPDSKDNGGDQQEDAAAAVSCEVGDLELLTEGTLTIATGQPSYPPWVLGDDPESGEGFEGAVAYAVAEEMGFGGEDVAWTFSEFNAMIAPGPKDFDIAINQFSIYEDRMEAVDFSSSYYDVRQAIVALAGNPAADATSLADLAEVRLGAQVETTSLTALYEFVDSEHEVSVYNSNDDGKVALGNGQIDGLAVDLPTAFYIASELADDDATVVGQLPQVAGESEQFGLVLEKDSPLTDCVSEAIDRLREDGTLERLETEWLDEVAEAPELG